MSDARPTAVIVGPGAIGGWLAAVLHSAGWRVKLLARGATLAAVRAHGLIYESGEQRLVLPVEASDNPAELGVADYVAITLKGQAMPEVGPRLGPLVGPETAIVSVMNGLPWWFCDGIGGPLDGMVLERVDPGGRLKALFPVSRVIGAVVHVSVVSPAPGHARVVGANRLILGEPDGSASPRLERLVAACSGVGMKTVQSPDIRRDIWSKLWGNMCMNPLSALTRASTGRMFADPEVTQLCVEMMGEMATIGAGAGIDLGMTPQDRMAVTRQLGDFKTSMLHDMAAGRALEVEGLLGVLVELAERLDRPVPFIRAVYGLTRVLSSELAAPG